MNTFAFTIFTCIERIHCTSAGEYRISRIEASALVLAA